MPIVTLTTDIGQQDFVVGAVKGQLLSQNSALNIVDINHYLSQTNYPQAAYICSNAFKYFPDNTVHIVLLNFFDTSVKQLIIAKHNNQFIVCADNGIITMIIGQIPSEMVAVSIDDQPTLLQRTATIAHIVNLLTTTHQLSLAGLPATNIVEKYPLRATIGPHWMEGQILFIDNFENVVVNINKKEFEEQRNGRKFTIVFKRNEMIDTISDNYSSVNEGEKMAWFNSAGYLEIAINKGNMAGLFGLQGYNENQHKHGHNVQNKLFYQTVRIFFE